MLRAEVPEEAVGPLHALHHRLKHLLESAGAVSSGCSGNDHDETAGAGAQSRWWRPVAVDRYIWGKVGGGEEKRRFGEELGKKVAMVERRDYVCIYTCVVVLEF